MITVVNKFKCSIKPYKYIEDGWTKIPNNTFKVLGNKPYEFLVYCYLCKNFNKDNGYAYPSKSYMAKDLGINIKTVNKAIKYLEENSLIRIFKFKKDDGSYVNNCYIINYIDKILDEKVEFKTTLTEEQLKEIEDYYSTAYDEDIIITNEYEDYEDYNPDMWEEYERQEHEAILKRLEENKKKK